MNKTKVVVVDDSVVIRKILTSIINADAELEVVGEAVDPFDARDKIKALRPDVITLDIQMPKMDGITFLDKLMRLHPMPVVMISSLTQDNAEVTLAALELGAIDYVPKPSHEHDMISANYQREVIEKIKIAAQANIQGIYERIYKKPMPKVHTPSHPGLSQQKIIAIGASTGGTEATRVILSELPENCPPVVITQHIAPAFCESYARRLNEISPLRVNIAQEGMPIKEGNVYIAPGNAHFEIVLNRDKNYFCHLNNGPEVNFLKPSIDIMFQSLLLYEPENVIAAVLTGMGNDGALSIKKLRDAGAKTIAQSKDTCVVWGMPRAVEEIGGADYILPIERIAAEFIKLI